MPAEPFRKTLHIAPGDSAGGSLRQAIREAGHDDAVLSFRDDLSCGLIDPDDAALREDWWSGLEEEGTIEHTTRTFWSAVAQATDDLVVWYSRHSARELAFFLSWVERLRGHPYQVIDGPA